MVPLTVMRAICKFIGCHYTATDKIEDLITKMARFEWGSAYTTELGMDCLRSRVLQEDEALKLFGGLR